MHAANKAFLYIFFERDKTFLYEGGHFGDWRDSGPRPNRFNTTFFKGYCWDLVSNDYTGMFHNFHEWEQDVRATPLGSLSPFS